MIHVSKCYYCGDYYDSAERTWLEICYSCEADELEEMERYNRAEAGMYDVMKDAEARAYLKEDDE